MSTGCAPARTIIDLMRGGAGGGHLAGVIADAERRGLIDPVRLAPAAARFAPRYAVPGADGIELMRAPITLSVPTQPRERARPAA